VERSGDLLFLPGEEFAWVEPQSEPQPAAAARARPRKKRPRTFARDVARLRAGLRAWTAALPGGARSMVIPAAFLLLAGLAALFALRGGKGNEASAPLKPLPRLAVSAPPNAPTSMEMLRRGDRKPAVADLQQALAALGLYSQPADGVFGDSTGAAVLAFQRNRGLAPDGVAGPATMKALGDAVAEGAKSDAAIADAGLASAAESGRLSSSSAHRFRSLLADSLSRLERLSPGRVATLALVFRNVAAHTADYDEHRALVLFPMLEANAGYLAKHAPPTTRTDIEDGAGIAYRYFPGYGFQFHPIAAFARLNSLARRQKTAEVRRLATALVARGVPTGNELVWEYYFPFGGPSRWTSGFAQATAAQALARSAALLHDPGLFKAARAAFRAIPNELSLDVGGGVWIREYGYTDMAILNAQLQSLISLREYVRISGDNAAGAYVAKQETASRALLPSFDTGCWSRYSLNGSPASLDYHKYHVALLQSLAKATGDPVWAETAARWKGYLAAGPC
jgi:hypothetical protein